MAVWELALLIFAVTYGVINTLYMLYMMKIMNKFTGIFDASCKYMEKIMKKATEDLDETE